MVWGAATAVVASFWAALEGLPAVFVAIAFLATLVTVVALVRLTAWLYNYLPKRKPPLALRSEVAAAQRGLIRLDNRRQMNGGPVWPVERPYHHLPSEQWDAIGGFCLREEDRQAVERAYALLASFNDEMLRGEGIIASSAAREPDLDGLRNAFDHAAEALGLPAMNDDGERALPEGDGLRHDAPFSVTMSPFVLSRLQHRIGSRERDPWALSASLRVINHSPTARVSIDLELRVPTEWSDTNRLIEPMTADDASRRLLPHKFEIDFPLTLGPEQMVKGTVSFEFQPMAAGEEDAIEEDQIRLVATDHISQRVVEIVPQPHLSGKINRY